MGLGKYKEALQNFVKARDIDPDLKIDDDIRFCEDELSLQQDL